MSETGFDLNSLGYDAEAARASRRKIVADGIVGQWIISSAEAKTSAAGNPMIITKWDIFGTPGDSNTIVRANVFKRLMLPVSKDESGLSDADKLKEKQKRGIRTAELDNFVERIGAVGATRPSKGASDDEWNAYKAALKSAVAAFVSQPSSVIGKSSLGRHFYDKDKEGNFVMNGNYRNANLFLYGTELPPNVAFTSSENFFE